MRTRDPLISIRQALWGLFALVGVSLVALGISSFLFVVGVSSGFGGMNLGAALSVAAGPVGIGMVWLAVAAIPVRKKLLRDNWPD